jgi:polyphenol oxidase
MWPLAGLHWITPQWPAPPNVLALTTMRGVSDGSNCSDGNDCYSGFNLAHHVNDDAVRVQRNRDSLQYALGLTQVQWLEQVHGVDVADANADGRIRCADAVHTAQKNLACAVLTADCLPVVFCNRDGSEVAAAHAGWRGLCAGVLENTVQRFKSPPAQLMAWLGPAIGPQAFEVGPEVREAFIAAQSGIGPKISADVEKCFVASPRKANHFLADLYQLARLRLHSVGVDVVFGGGFCTSTDPRFYSYRRAAVTGRLATCIMLQ